MLLSPNFRTMESDVIGHNHKKNKVNLVLLLINSMCSVRLDEKFPNINTFLLQASSCLGLLNILIYSTKLILNTPPPGTHEDININIYPVSPFDIQQLGITFVVMVYQASLFYHRTKCSVILWF